MTTRGGTTGSDSDQAITRSKARGLGVVLLVVVLGGMVPLLIASHYGALRIPRSDDWSYLVTLFRWVDHGRLGFNNWVSMTLIGQLVLAAPIAAIFHRSIVAIHIFSAGIGVVGLLALVYLGRRVLPHGRGAVLIAVTIAVGPLWGPLAPTFMTDVPAFAAQMVSLGLAVSAFRAPRMSLHRLGAALAVGFLAISIRQYELVPELAILIVAIGTVIRERDRVRTRAVALMTVAVVVATAALLVWWSSLPDSLSLSPNPQTSSLVANLVVLNAGFLRLTGLLICPILAWLGPMRLVRRSWTASSRMTLAMGAAVSAWMLITYVRSSTTPFVGNYIDRFGVLSNDVLQGKRIPVMPTMLFDALSVIGSVAGVLIAVALVPFIIGLARRVRERSFTITDPRTTILALTVAGFSAAYLIAIGTKLHTFDRYALPAIPLVGILLIGTVERRGAEVREPLARSLVGTRLAGTLVAIAFVAVVGAIITTDSASFDGARWRVDEAAQARGYSPAAIDGGFEWTSFHRERGPSVGHTLAEWKRLRPITSRGLCVTVVVNPVQAVKGTVIARGWVRGLGHRAEPVVAFRNGRHCTR